MEVLLAALAAAVAGRRPQSGFSIYKIVFIEIDIDGFGYGHNAKNEKEYKTT